MHPCSGFYIVLGETQEGPAAMGSTLQGRGERSEEAERGDYLNLHLRSWERNSYERKKNCGLPLREKRTIKNAFALFRRCSSSTVSSQHMRDNNTPHQPLNFPALVKTQTADRGHVRAAPVICLLITCLSTARLREESDGWQRGQGDRLGAVLHPSLFFPHLGEPAS